MLMCFLQLLIKEHYCKKIKEQKSSNLPPRETNLENLPIQGSDREISSKVVKHGNLERTQSSSSRLEDWNLRLDGGTGLEEGYVGFFIQLLGLDNAPPNRDQEIKTLWKHSNGGK